MSRIYLYKMTVDNGGAPCVYRDVLTLAICKPAIRRRAQPGDMILGFAANHVKGWRPPKHYDQNRLIYVARVGRSVPGTSYYSDPWYASRPDSVYGWDGDRYHFRDGAKYHAADDMDRDLGRREEGHRSARVLMSCEFRYFAEPGPPPHSSNLPLLSEAIRGLGRGALVNHSPELEDEINRFLPVAWMHPGGCIATDVPKSHCEDRCDQDDEVIECDC